MGGRGTLPPQHTRFVGRRPELDELLERVPDTPLLSLVGPPGCGKTRLAVELGTRLEERLPGGVAFVDLAPVAAEHLVSAVAAALEVGEGPAGRPATAS